MLHTKLTPEDFLKSVKHKWSPLFLLPFSPPEDSNIPWSSLTDMCWLVLQVPTVRSRTVATINVTIQGESALMSKKTKILIEPPAFIHIIQTDKPVYKPGQTGKYLMSAYLINIIITLTQDIVIDSVLELPAVW